MLWRVHQAKSPAPSKIPLVLPQLPGSSPKPPGLRSCPTLSEAPACRSSSFPSPVHSSQLSCRLPQGLCTAVPLPSPHPPTPSVGSRPFLEEASVGAPYLDPCRLAAILHLSIHRACQSVKSHPPVSLHTGDVGVRPRSPHGLHCAPSVSVYTWALPGLVCVCRGLCTGDPAVCLPGSHRSVPWRSCRQGGQRREDSRGQWASVGSLAQTGLTKPSRLGVFTGLRDSLSPRVHLLHTVQTQDLPKGKTRLNSTAIRGAHSQETRTAPRTRM